MNNQNENAGQLSSFYTNKLDKPMTAEEQAMKIYSDMLYHLEWDYGENIHNNGVAKACAYIAAALVIKELVVTDFDNRFDYWVDVKKEIVKI